MKELSKEDFIKYVPEASEWYDNPRVVWTTEFAHAFRLLAYTRLDLEQARKDRDELLTKSKTMVDVSESANPQDWLDALDELHALISRIEQSKKEQDS